MYVSKWLLIIIGRFQFVQLKGKSKKLNVHRKVEDAEAL